MESVTYTIDFKSFCVTFCYANNHVIDEGTGETVEASVSLLIGALGFVLCFFVHDQYMMFIPFLLIGCAWAAMLAMPFALLTNALSGSSSMGAYLGLFNCTICLPQIVAALLGGVIMGLVGGTQVMMLVVSGICLLLGSVAVAGIKAKA